MNVARFRGTAAVVNGYICVAGGRNNAGTEINSVEMYNPQTDEWVQLAPMVNTRSSFALVQSNGLLYALGRGKVAERYDSWRMCWSKVNA